MALRFCEDQLVKLRLDETERTDRCQVAASSMGILHMILQPGLATELLATALTYILIASDQRPCWNRLRFRHR